MVSMCGADTQEELVQKAIQSDLLQYQLQKFKPKISFRFEQGPYVIETAQTRHDLEDIIRLRNHSFLEDFLPNTHITWVDFDEYDLIADHVLVKNIETKELLGTYRIISSDATRNYYSETQFDLGTFKNQSGVKIELGRACIHKKYRSGTTISLVWKGLGRYAIETGARYMFGCASIKTTSRIIAESIYWHLAPAHLDNTYKMKVLEKYQFMYEFHDASLIPWK